MIHQLLIEGSGNKVSPLQVGNCCKIYESLKGTVLNWTDNI